MSPARRLMFGQQKIRSTNARKDAGARATGDPNLRRYQQLISADRLAAQLFYLASDSFEGRETTLRGQKLAALYLASQYRQLGLTAFGPKSVTTATALDALFQPFTVYRRVAKESQLELLRMVKSRSPANTRLKSRTIFLTFLPVTSLKRLKPMLFLPDMEFQMTSLNMTTSRNCGQRTCQ